MTCPTGLTRDGRNLGAWLKVPTPSFELVNLKIKEIIKAATSKNDTEVVKLLKDLIPEYKSENSSFKFLDVDKVV